MNSPTACNMIKLCEALAEHENLKVALAGSTKAAAVVGLSTLVGGLLAGPLGIAIAGSVSSITVALNLQGEFKPVIVILSELNDDQKRRLNDAIQNIVNDIRAEDVAGLLTVVLTTGSLKKAVLAEISKFLLNEFRLKIIT
ncbi:hypothetical protein ABEB36_007236 [Hypothenemus hampei]|uniref:Uncharacterized protein n=1 Tax=Hypothenemus hampei TaxID=57062 RepID=A0ABD1ETA0_HYPHA